MSDVVWQAIIAAVLAIYMEWSRRKTAGPVAEVVKEAKATAKEVKAVKTALQETSEEKLHAIQDVQTKLADNTAVTVEVKDLVNGQKAALIAEVAALKVELAGEIARHVRKGDAKP